MFKTVWKSHYTWELLEEDIDQIIEQIDIWKPSAIVGLARGGLIPAVMLSHKLDVPLIPLTIQTRDYQKSEMISLPAECLVVDDINDSGRTLELFKQTTQLNVDQYRTCTLLSKLTSNFVVDYYARPADNSNWYVFPWEHDEKQVYN